jgi:Helix-turn-helix domain
MLTGRRFRVELTDEQGEYAERIAGACRAVWNTGLEQRRAYRRRGAWMDYRKQAGELAEAKTEHTWLADVPGHCLQQTLMDLAGRVGRMARFECGGAPRAGGSHPSGSRRATRWWFSSLTAGTRG